MRRYADSECKLEMRTVSFSLRKIELQGKKCSITYSKDISEKVNKNITTALRSRRVKIET